jgi:hypothetical protein
LGRTLYLSLTNRSNAAGILKTRGPGFVMPSTSLFSRARGSRCYVWTCSWIPWIWYGKAGTGLFFGCTATGCIRQQRHGRWRTRRLTE